jgi:hypothetical protein
VERKGVLDVTDSDTLAFDQHPDDVEPIRVGRPPMA